MKSFSLKGFGEPSSKGNQKGIMQSFSLKSILVSAAIFAITLGSGLFLVGSVSPAKESSFEFGRGHRARDLKMQAELERMQELNDELQQRLDELEMKLEQDSQRLQTSPAIPVTPDVPNSPVAPDALDKVPMKKSAPVNPTVRTKAKEEATF